MSISERRYVIIAWPPDTPESVFPKGWQIYPHSIWHFPIQEERCPRCGFTVKWIIRKDEFDEWNERVREEIRGRLQAQRGECLCPGHPKTDEARKQPLSNPLKRDLRCIFGWLKRIIGFN